MQVFFLALFAYGMIQFGMFLQSRQKHTVASSSHGRLRLQREPLPISLDVDTLLAMSSVSRIRALETCFGDIACNLLVAQELSFAVRVYLRDVTKHLWHMTQPLVDREEIEEHLSRWSSGDGAVDCEHPIEIAYPLLIDALRGGLNLVDDLSESAQECERIMKERGDLLTVFDDCEPFVRSAAQLWRASHTAVEHVRSISFQVRELEEMISDIGQEVKNKVAKIAIGAAA